MIDGLETKLPDVLAHFGIEGNLGKIFEGPLITEVEFQLSHGAKFSNVTKSIKDIARELGVSGIRVSEIPNSTYICFEIPQPKAQTIPFQSVTQSPEFVNATYALPICIGVNMRGLPIMRDLSKMPHLLVAGTTGSGKSVGLNSFILSLIHKLKPENLKFVLIDPKRIEFSMYNNQKYMLRPVITDMGTASQCLVDLCREMNDRYEKFEKTMVRNISEYHEKGYNLPYIVCVIDEFADLIMFDKTVEKQVLMLAQKARAAGIHLVIATQRPSVDVITGTIKANLPTRLSYKVASPADSMTILNTTGAEDLLGRGDSLLLEENGTLTRVLGAYMPNEEIMQTLEPYRCAIKEPTQSVEVHSSNSNVVINQTTINHTTVAKPGLFARFADWWQRLGKRNQNKIINWLFAFVVYVIHQMSGSGSSRRSSPTGTSSQKLLKKGIKKIVQK
ncbi:MAG: DUF87 domain-containing protein [Alphaproteobacteria bacterium]|nr:DUF87 domain-containing protein [Alphaproteobacteria bacterium]